MKRLQVTNGEVHDAVPCEDCDTAVLPPAYEFCPYCGDEL
jgi:RNA polymerase subunit RPABC4/transcription elongation factor Spt4